MTSQMNTIQFIHLFGDVYLGIQPYDSPNLTWDYRELEFLTPRNSCTIKFLPFDDDSSQNVLDNEGLRMGIDNIKLEAMNVCYSAVEMPNVFTPDGNGINEYFSPITFYGIEQYHFVIQNCWGNIVFETTDESMYWDGTVAGAVASEGTYFWKASYINLDGRNIEKQGFFSLIR